MYDKLYSESWSIVEINLPMGNGCGCPTRCSGSYPEGTYTMAQTTAKEEHT